MDDIKATLKVGAIEEGEHDRQTLEGMVHMDVAEFEIFFMSMNNESLSDYEKNIIRTYLMYKLGAKMKE